MSVHVMSWVLRHSEAHLADRLVLLVLADKADEDGSNAWPSVATIARESRLTERQAQRSLKHLRETGQIAQTGRHRANGQNHGTYVYSVIMKDDKLSPLDEPKGDIHDIPRVAQMSPEPSLVQPPEEQLLAAAPRQWARNPLWDALTEVFGEPTTPGAVKVRGKVCAGLTAARADPSEVVRRARSWPAHFDGATMTDLALEKHWDTLGRKPLRRRS